MAAKWYGGSTGLDICMYFLQEVVDMYKVKKKNNWIPFAKA